MRKALVLAATILSVGLAGCSETNRSDRAVAGAGIGALTGAAIGGLATGRTGGALAGAAIGGIGGAIIGAETTPDACYARDRRGRILRDEYGDPIRVRCR